MPMGEFEIRAIGLGVLLPAAVSSAFLVAFTTLGRCRRGLAALSGPVALAMSVWAGFFALSLGQFFPFGKGWVWLPHLAALAIPTGWAAGFSHRRLLILPIGVVTAGLAIAMIVPNSAVVSKENVSPIWPTVSKE